MDKRYLLILIIIVVCCINLFFIVENSYDIGSASATVGRYTFSMPSGFSLYNSNTNHAYIHNDENNISINYDYDISKKDTYESMLNYINNQTDDKVLSNGTIKINDLEVDAVYFQSDNHTNESAFYFEKDNVPFKLMLSGFNYDKDYDLTLDYVKFIIQSTRFDFKSN